MPEFILDFIQCHHCEERFKPDEVSESDHWKVCEKSPARAEVRRLQDELDAIKSQLDSRSIHRFAIENGAWEVHRSWRDNMLSQEREVAEDRMSWKSLPEIDKELDTAISYDVILDFVGYVLGHPHDV